jgi:CubicO group peptidase (beta-lactamase class C family)
MSQFDAVWLSLDDKVASGHAPGMVAGIRHRGETEIYATGYRTFDTADPMESTTPFRIASLSKLVAGALAVQLIDDGTFTLADTIDRWLPELANPRVLTTLDGPLDDTVAADTPITVEHLLNYTNGIGVIFEDTPLSRAIAEQGVGPGAIPPQMTADEFMKRIGELPLAHQPGQRFMYSTAGDIFSVLVERASGMPLAELVRQRITQPLGMHATGFEADPADLPTVYMNTGEGFEIIDHPQGYFSQPPQFATLAAGLVSTVPDYLTFLTALADGTLLPAELQHRMTSDQLTSEQRRGSAPILDDTISWGWSVSVALAGNGPGQTPGSYGWNGGTGTTAFVDPANDLVACLFTQRMMAGPADGFDYFMEPLANLLR